MTLKPTNPKDQAAVDRSALGLIPTTALVHEALAWYEGLLKYGAHNYTIKGVRSSVYVFGTLRHTLKWWCGQRTDAKTGVHHLGSARACLGVLLDAEQRGKLEDDRPPALPGVDELFSSASEIMRRLFSLYGDDKPRHYSIADTELPEPDMKAAERLPQCYNCGDIVDKNEYMSGTDCATYCSWDCWDSKESLREDLDSAAGKFGGEQLSFEFGEPVTLSEKELEEWKSK